MQRSTNYLIAGSWFLFLLVIVFLDAVWSAPIHILKAAIGLLGVAVSVALLYRQRRWPIVASAVLAAILLLVYASEFGLRASSYKGVAPETSWLATVWLKVLTSYAAPLRLAEEGFVGRAAGELYWNLGMPLLQLIILALLIGQYRLKRGSQEGHWQGS